MEPVKLKSMKSLYSILAALLILSCRSKDDRGLSDSYKELKKYFSEAGIKETDKIFFYEDKPRMPLPNVYCFNKAGNQIATPPGCFGIIQDYIRLLQDSVIQEMKNGQNLQLFLDSIHIMDVYDNLVSISSLKGDFDYYLFVDYIALPDPGFQKILNNIVVSANQSRKKIKLLLVHALSEKNKGAFSKKEEKTDSIKPRNNIQHQKDSAN